MSQSQVQSHPLSSPTFPWSSDSSVTPFNVVRRSCQQCIQHSHYVTINHEAIKQYALNLNKASLHLPHRVQYPLNFLTVASEINFICVRALLEFGSGFRDLLHKAHGRGASETISYGCIGLHITGEINAGRLRSMDLHQTAEMFGLSINEEYEIQPGIHGERRTPLYLLAQQLCSVMNEAGGVLRSLQCTDFNEFIFMKKPRSSQADVAGIQTETASSLVKRLVEHFPSFADRVTLQPSSSSDVPDPSSSNSDGMTVYFFKRAQLLAFDLYTRFHDSDPRLNFPDIQELTIMADNVLPCVLRALTLLIVDPNLSTKIDEGILITDRRMECELRAGAVVACDEIVSEYASSHPSGESLTAAELDYHLWHLGKQPEMRSLPRHATQDTVYY